MLVCQRILLAMFVKEDDTLWGIEKQIFYEEF
jgi:hypothetical protein